jgi:hypothetical protein
MKRCIEPALIKSAYRDLIRAFIKFVIKEHEKEKVKGPRQKRASTKTVRKVYAFLYNNKSDMIY